MSFSTNLLKKINSDLILLSILFLFFFQMVTDLIQSIYTLDLLHTSLDEKVLGILFLISPISLLAFRNKIPGKFIEITAVILVISRVISPLVNTSLKIIVAGIGVAFFLIFLTSFLFKNGKDGEAYSGRVMGFGLSIAVLLSIAFRSLNSTVDISMYKAYQVIGWVLAFIAVLSLLGRSKFGNISNNIVNKTLENNTNPSDDSKRESTTSSNIYRSILGIFGVFLFIYFALLSPTVISRWTEGNYILITISLSIMIAVFAIFISFKPGVILNLSGKMLVIWNLLFILCVFLTIIVNVVIFPSTPDQVVIVNSPPPWYSYIPLIGMIALSPIIFIDFTFFCSGLFKQTPSLSKLSKGFTLGGVLFILLTLALIFTNVWGYVEPVSTPFRNLFWLPFLLIGLFITWPMLKIKKSMHLFNHITIPTRKSVLSAFVILILVLTTIVGVIITNPSPAPTQNNNVLTLRIMTYNIQQGVNVSGDMNYDKQLELIKNVNPDILGLEESDTARVSGGNSDVVRYFANRLTGLNYYSFYGPKTVTGTYGAAILSKYPIISAKTIFSYSDTDEIGTTYVQIQVGNQIFNVFVSHPDGSDTAKLAQVNALLAQIDNKDNVISMGDFNSRENTIFYKEQAAVLKDVWRAKWPNGVDNNGLVMTSSIDHIFVSQKFIVIDARFITNPQSDHPALWAEIKI